MDNINVNPGTAAGKVSVATDDVDGVHYPIYKQATGKDGEASLVTDENPLPVMQSKLTHETDIVAALCDISNKLTVLIEYEKLLHKVDFTEGTDAT